MSSKKRNQLLARVNFPLYTVHCLTERHILVAGGGGGAKTGIRNVIEIYELINSGSCCRAESVTHYETGKQAIMNCTVFHNGKYYVLAAGMEGMCQLYQMKFRILDQNGVKHRKSTEKQSSIRQRRRTSSESAKSKSESADLNKEATSHPERQTKKSDSNANSILTKIGFDIQPLQSFATDFSDDPFQKLVRFSKPANILVTAGADGHIRVWNYPQLAMKHDIAAHTDDVDDLDISPEGDKIVSVSRDGHGYIWNSKDSKKVCELKYELPNRTEGKYIFRSCRYSVVEGNSKTPALFTTLNPAVRKKPPYPSYLCKWNTQNYVLEKMVSTGTDMLTVMAVSDDGRFIGLGTQEGSVAIYIAFSLQLLQRAEHVHGIFVTGLEFLQTSEETRRITGGHDSSLISISVDNHINVHYIPQPSTMGVFSIVIMFIMVLLVTYVIMDFLNL